MGLQSVRLNFQSFDRSWTHARQPPFPDRTSPYFKRMIPLLIERFRVQAAFASMYLFVLRDAAGDN